MDFFQAVILGIVQGITAYIPVSSKTQVILFGTILFGLSFKELLSFAIAVHIGDIIASVYLFRKELISMIGVVPKIDEIQKIEELEERKKIFYFMGISLFFTALVGVPLYLGVRGFFSDIASNTLLAFIGLMLILMTIIQYVSKKEGGDAKLNLKTTIISGMAQGLAVLPGISRSGITTSSLLLQNIDKQRAVKLSFIMSIPMISAAVLLFNFTDGFESLSIPIVIAGIIASTISSYLTMNFMLELVKRVKFYYFTLIIGLIALIPYILSKIGWIN